MIKIKNIPIFWGILDLLSMAWIVGMHIYRGEIPIVHDISSGTISIRSFGFPNYTFLIYIGVLLFYSPILSGILLIVKKKAGLIVSYLQTPFRLVMIIPPSIFFIQWPLNDSLDKITVLGLGFSLVIISETIKVSTLFLWNKKK